VLPVVVGKSASEGSTSLTRGRLAKVAGVGAEALRFYEKQGLLPKPKRDNSGYRRYTPEMAQRLRFITHAKDLGFTLREIHELLELRDLADDTCSPICDRINAKIAEVEKKIRSLTLLGKCLEKLAAACDGGQPIESCPILHFIEQMERMEQDCLALGEPRTNEKAKPKKKRK